MQELDNSDHTIVGRVVELQLALRIIEPGLDFSWISSPGGIALRSLLPMVVRRLERHDSHHLYLWGLQLMDTAATRSTVRRRVQFRDGLLIAILACRAPRLRSVTAMCLGLQVLRTKTGFRLDFRAEDIKTKRPIAYGLPDALTPYIERYLAVERRELLKGQSHDAFWVNWSVILGENGSKNASAGIPRGSSGSRSGRTGSRHALGTTQAIADPANPAAGAALLGISPEMAEKHYNIGGQVEAAQAFTASVEQARMETAGLAQRIFEQRIVATWPPG